MSKKSQYREIRNGILKARADLGLVPYSMFSRVFSIESEIGMRAYRRTCLRFFRR